jgi:hypothetical protein
LANANFLSGEITASLEIAIQIINELPEAA